MAESLVISTVDHLDVTVVSALKFLDSYRFKGGNCTGRGAEFLLYYTRTIRDYVGPGEAFDYDKVPYPDRRVIRNFENGTVPDGVRALKSLETQGFPLPMTFYSPEFEALNVLSLAIQFSGRMDHNYCFLYHDRDVDVPRGDRLEQLLGKVPSNPLEGRYIIASNAGLPVGRVLAQLGVSRKAAIHGLSFPYHLQYLALKYKLNELDDRQREVAQNLLYDAMATLFYTSGKQDRPNSLLRFPAQLSKANAQSLGIEVMFFIKSLFPSVEIEASCPSRVSLNRKLPSGTNIYTPSVKLSLKSRDMICEAIA